MKKLIGLGNVVDTTLRTLLGNRALLNAAVAIGSTKTNVATGAFDYCIDGKAYSKAAVAAGTAFTAGTPVVPADSTALYAVNINAAGTIKLVPGFVDQPGQTNPATGLPISTVGNQNALYPPEDGYITVGAVKVVTVGVTFTPATTELDAAGITATYTSFAVPPAAAL